jgi:hypothetical protein
MLYPIAVAIRACHHERPATIPLEAMANVFTIDANRISVIQRDLGDDERKRTVERIRNPKVQVTDSLPLSFMRRHGQEILARQLPVDGCDASFGRCELDLVYETLEGHGGLV